MKNIFRDSYSFVCLVGFLVTLAITPWVNSDSLVIPKLIILFSVSLYLVPKVFTNRVKLFENKLIRGTFYVCLLIIMHMLLVIISSEAPLEQQLFGRTGRGLGFFTQFALIIFLITSMIYVSYRGLKQVLFFIVLSGLVTSIYSILQRFGLDVFEWNTRTNGIIGTLGNPNFQSSFAAMVLIPSIALFWSNNKGRFISLFLCAPIIFLIYISQSTQGYILGISTIIFFTILYFWFKSRYISYNLILIAFVSGIFIIYGMLNKGPLSTLLFKGSVQSRGEFFRTGLSIASDNPFLGVGLDSIGDYYLMYRSEQDSRGIGEFTDHIHNSFLNNASVGGYPFALLQFSLIVIGLTSFILIQKRIGAFNKFFTAMFCAWICYQLQSLISPENISMLLWNAILTGSIIGLTRYKSILETDNPTYKKSEFQISQPFSNLFLLMGIIVIYPLFNVDKMQLMSIRTGNANLAIESAISYPESTIRYSRIGQELIKSNLAPQALELGRAAARFNPNAASAWGLILINNMATVEERQTAKRELLRLDPYNLEIQDLEIPNTSNQP